MNARRLWMLTGERGAGKTRFCRALASQARAAGWDAAGLLSPAVFEGDAKTGIEVENLQTGEVRPLAVLKERPGFTLRLGEWHFDQGALGWGNGVLEGISSCDLLVVDEIGPLELLRGEGWTAALETLRGAKYCAGVVVVRPELKEAAEGLLPIDEVIQLDAAVTPEEDALRWWKRITGGS